MGLIDKNTTFPEFDRVVRTNQGEALLAHIFATYWERIGKQKDKTRKENIADRLRPLYDIFKGTAGTYGQDDDKIAKQYQRQYTIGHDMGIWIDSELHLSKYALEVAESKITVREYISRVFINLFTYLNDKYTHILYNICVYIEKFEFEEIDSHDIILALIDYKDSEFSQKERIYIKQYANSIFHYLVATNFFITTDKGCMKFEEGYTASKIKNMCNIEYKEANGEETREHFINKENYANYVGQPIKYNNSSDKHINKLDNIENKKEDNINISEIESILVDYNIQKLIYGPPGTGKSYSITDEIRNSYPSFNLTKDNPFVFRTTLHPEYSYNDFVGQVMPVVKDETITYDFTPGIFTQALHRAIKYSNNDTYLILEEMSRANVAAIFGDIFQLLDREDGVSEYRINNDLISEEIYKSKQKIFLPKNLHIIGTVNTSDQNVYVMDTAFKRRFDLDYMDLDPVTEIDPDTGSIVPLNNYIIIFKDSRDDYTESSWIEFYQKFNEFIITKLKLSEDKQLGQFFIKFTDNDQINKKSIYSKLLQYIWQDIHLISYSNSSSLFQENINSFSKAYNQLKDSLESENNITIFSDEFIKTLKNYTGQTSNVVS